MGRDSPHRTHKKHRHHKTRERSRSPFERPPLKRRSASVENDEPHRTNADISLSVSETNALRAKLGLAPLETGDVSSQERPVDNQADNFVHAPAKDLRKIKEDQSIREKIEVLKDKRRFYEKLGHEKLSSLEDEDSNVLSWVEKMREKEKIKRQAIERAKSLAEMDEQLGITEFVQTRLNSSSEPKYKANELVGMRVEHDVNRFVEGHSVVLTIKDQDVLEESDAVLVNVNMVDDEKADANRENLRKTAGLAGIEDQEDEDVLLGLRSKGVLSKYDTEIQGEQKAQFVIGSDGSYITENERLLNQLQNELKEGRQSLPDSELRVASEYYTPEEMAAKFKKRKRRVKTIRQTLTADELLKEQYEPSNSNDLGSRSSHRSGCNNDEAQPKSEGADVIESISQLISTETTDSMNVLEADWPLDDVDEPDELRGELEKSIGHFLQTTKSKIVHQPEEITSQLLNKNKNFINPNSNQPNTTNSSASTSDVKNNKIIFDSTAEFYKSIGLGFQETMKHNARITQFNENKLENDSHLEEISIKTENRDDQNLDMSLSENENNHDDDNNTNNENDLNSTDYKSNSSNRWYTLGEDGGKSARTVRTSNNAIPDLKSEEIIHGVLDDEPNLDTGVFSALMLAQKKGYIDKDKEKRTGTGTMINLMAKHFVQEEIRYDDIDAKFVKRDRYSGPLSEFKEMANYKPDVKLEYVDDLGRELNAKEAFRQLSHKFHGKGSGKNKTEKRMKKIKEEFLLKASTSSDTPLGTAEKLNKKLKAMSLPYVILSGKNAAVKKLTK